MTLTGALTLPRAMTYCCKAGPARLSASIAPWSRQPGACLLIQSSTAWAAMSMSAMATAMAAMRGRGPQATGVTGSHRHKSRGESRHSRGPSRGPLGPLAAAHCAAAAQRPTGAHSGPRPAAHSSRRPAGRRPTRPPSPRPTPTSAHKLVGPSARRQFPPPPPAPASLGHWQTGSDWQSLAVTGAWAWGLTASLWPHCSTPQPQASDSWSDSSLLASAPRATAPRLGTRAALGPTTRHHPSPLAPHPTRPHAPQPNHRSGFPQNNASATSRLLSLQILPRCLASSICPNLLPPPSPICPGAYFLVKQSL